jgi:GH24 family phage-related lysozyme (muramidase)
MNKAITISVIAGLVLLALLTPSMAHAASEVFDVTDWLIPQFEGFSATPYWDVSRYSWGYGTPAPGATGTISPAAARVAMRAHVQDDYNALHTRITRALNPNQWGALLSFAYEEGHGNPGAGALVPDINAGDDSVLETHWKKYVYADGVVNQDIVDRRNKEWDIWMS